MAKPHHRKKHKQHVQQFKHRGDFVATKAKGKASYTFLVVGLIVGSLIGYFAGSGALIWVGIGFAIGGAAGYLVGHRVDSTK